MGKGLGYDIESSQVFLRHVQCRFGRQPHHHARVVISSKLLGKMPRGRREKDGKKSGGAQKAAPITGLRKQQIFSEGEPADQVNALVGKLKKQIDFSVGIPADTPIVQAERVVAAGKGIGPKENMRLIEDLARAAGAAIGSSRPVAETLQYVPLDRYVGMSGQKFTGNLYIACGISGAKQHLKGIKTASIIVAINKNPNAPIFKNCDYGIVGDVNVILPLLTQALDTGEKQPAPPMVKIQNQRGNMASIDIGIGHDDDLLIAQLV